MNIFKNLPWSVGAMVLGLLASMAHPDYNTPIGQLDNPLSVMLIVGAPLTFPIIHMAWNFAYFMVTNNLDEGE